MVPNGMFVELEEFPSYYVTDTGEVWSTKPNRNKQNGFRKLKQHHSRDGYCKIKLFRPNGTSKCCMVHRLVMTAFEGPPKGDIQVNHLDGDKDNNNLNNLQYCTPAENARHAHATGLMDNMRKASSERQKKRVGEKNSYAALTDEQATQILRLKGKVYLKTAAAQFGTTISVVHKLWQGKSYPHLPRD